jgi:two-component system, NarL family, response regulator NreC
MSSIRVLLVDDDTFWRQTFHCELHEEDGIVIVGEAKDGDTAIEMARRLRPDVLVTDIAHPGPNGYAVARAIVEQIDGVKILVYSGYAGWSHVERSLQAGAKGFVVKPERISVLVTAIKTVAGGGEFLSPGLSLPRPRTRPTTRAATRRPKPDR